MKSLKINLHWLLMGPLALSAGTGLYVMVGPGSSWTRADLLFSALNLAVYTLGWMACIRVGANRSMRWLAISAAFLLFLGCFGFLSLMMWNVWDVWEWPAWDMVEKLTDSANIFGVTLIGVGLMSMIEPRLQATRLVRLSTITFGIVLCVISILLSWDVVSEPHSSDIIGRIFFGSFILTSNGVLATYILSQIEILKHAEVAETT